MKKTPIPTTLESLKANYPKDTIWSEIKWQTWYYYRQIRCKIRDIKDDLHRVKHSWAPSDAWDACNSIPTYTSNVLGQFIKDLENECDSIETADLFTGYHVQLKKRLETAKTIKKGFDDHLWFQSEVLDFYICEEMTKKEYLKIKKDVQVSFQKSLKLMGEKLPELWW